MIPYVDLKAQYRSIKQEIDEAVEPFSRAASSFWANTWRPSRRISRVTGRPARRGSQLRNQRPAPGLLAAGVGPGDEVITTPFTSSQRWRPSTIAARAPCSPTSIRFPSTSTRRDRRLITARTKAILPVHLYGQPADMDPILEDPRGGMAARDRRRAQAHGPSIRAGRVGSMETWPASASIRERTWRVRRSGAVTTSNPEFARIIRMLRDWGQSRRYYHDLRASTTAWRACKAQSWG